MSSETPATDPEAQPTEPPASAGEPSADDASSGEPDRATLLAELERQRAETDRLRVLRPGSSEPVPADGAGLRRPRRDATAGGVLPETRTVLLALGGTGLFAALLTWFVTPRALLSRPTSVTPSTRRWPGTKNGSVSSVLGLSDERVYVPTGEESTGVRPNWMRPGSRERRAASLPASGCTSPA